MLMELTEQTCFRVIKTEEQYHTYLEKVGMLLANAPQPNSKEYDSLELLTTLIEDYESRNFPIGVIKTEEQYHTYLEKVGMLLANVPQPNSKEYDSLELLIILLESYENQRFPIEAPDPIDAILFRMEEKGLKQVDLVPYFGTKSRVSEVLARKRPLTVNMIRELSVGLGISAEILVSKPKVLTPNQEEPDWSKFPIKEMVTRGWINKASGKLQLSAEEQVKEFITQLGWQFAGAAFKRTISGNAYTATTKYKLYAWLARVIHKGREKRGNLGEFKEEQLSDDFLIKVAQLSSKEQGAKLAIELLEQVGIAIIIEPHFKGTMLDGAALKDVDGSPIIGLTLRYDRVDNFWFTLLHELVHIWKHVGKDETIMDDIDASSTSRDKKEAEANRITRNTFISKMAWRSSDVCFAPTEANIIKFSNELNIHPAIVAGRVRYESGDYKRFSNLVGQGEIRKMLLNSQTEVQE